MRRPPSRTGLTCNANLNVSVLLPLGAGVWLRWGGKEQTTAVYGPNFQFLVEREGARVGGEGLILRPVLPKPLLRRRPPAAGGAVPGPDYRFVLLREERVGGEGLVLRRAEPRPAPLALRQQASPAPVRQDPRAKAQLVVVVQPGSKVAA